MKHSQEPQLKKAFVDTGGIDIRIWYQSVMLNGATSSRKVITCGVPQGSILEPLLFLIYINDMHYSAMSSTVYHFADDTNLMCSSKNLKRLRKDLNKDLDLLYDWLCANRLSINTGKTEFIVLGLQDITSMHG